eukprot:105157_1
MRKRYTVNADDFKTAEIPQDKKILHRSGSDTRELFLGGKPPDFMQATINASTDGFVSLGDETGSFFMSAFTKLTKKYVVKKQYKYLHEIIEEVQDKLLEETKAQQIKPQYQNKTGYIEFHKRDINMDKGKERAEKLAEMASESMQNVMGTSKNVIDKKESYLYETESIQKQFLAFLSRMNMAKYFNKFQENDCCDMQSILYFDDDFLKDDIGIKNRIARKKFIGECNKMRKQMDEFQNDYGITAFVYDKLARYGIVTVPILCYEVKNIDDLKGKLKITNDNQCTFLLQIIQNQNYNGVDQQNNTAS